MARRTLFFAVFAIAVSLGCVRLGFWQVSRLRERQARNAAVVERLRFPPAPVTALPADTGVRFRRSWAEGRYDFAHELVLAGRSRLGSPGVHILTPLRLTGSDTAVLVNRGWVYSADGVRVDLVRWREPEQAHVEGFVEEFSREPAPVRTPSFERAVRRLNLDSIRARVPYPIHAVVLVQQRDSGVAAAAASGTPVRAEPPPLGEGSHRAYAVQWFGFALVGLVGTAMVVLRDRQRGRGRSRGEGARPLPGPTG
ncbi:MAG TPA: SURF1 family protein [Gemmatimonadaceae bacterium]|nr:SURF1 family protein [Gemmatimonadaceae bacterium]